MKHRLIKCIILMIVIIALAICMVILTRKGDVDYNGVISNSDLVKTNLYIHNQNKAGILTQYRMDINCDGQVNQKDVDCINYIILNEINE